MLNISFAFRDAEKAVTEYGGSLDIPALVPAVFMMQRDVINHYRHGLEHYFTLTLREPFLQISSIGSPYQKWAYFVNENFEHLSFVIRQLLGCTSRLLHETVIKRMTEQRKFSDSKDVSNQYTAPICEMRSRQRPVGFRVLEGGQLIVTWIRKSLRTERVRAESRADMPKEYFLVEAGPEGTEIKKPISVEEYLHFSESVSQTVFDISDRGVLHEIKAQGMKEVLELEALHGSFRAAAGKFLQGTDPYPPHLPMTHAPFSSAEPRKQIPFRNASAPINAPSIKCISL